MRGAQDARNLAFPFQGIRDVTFSLAPKSPILIYLEATRKLVVCDGTEHRVLTGPENQIYRFAFSPDGKQIAAANYNATRTFGMSPPASGLALKSAGDCILSGRVFPGMLAALIKHLNQALRPPLVSQIGCSKNLLTQSLSIV